jgi:uncharacterized cysteine cluster protein YcgN (CxxCxxCC family)
MNLFAVKWVIVAPQWRSTAVARSVEDMLEVPECLVCGTCCFSKLENYVRVSGDDYARLGERATDLTRFDGNRAYMRMIDGHCLALDVEPQSGRFLCDAYDNRPQICRDLARNSRECHGEIATKHQRPLLALGRGIP